MGDHGKRDSRKELKKKAQLSPKEKRKLKREKKKQSDGVRTKISP
jgi:hypothetical protein